MRQRYARRRLGAWREVCCSRNADIVERLLLLPNLFPPTAFRVAIGAKMKNFDSRTYSINDFREWNDRQQLELAPRFQRRDVWTDKARSFLMDTILRGK